MPLITEAACNGDLTARIVGNIEVDFIYSHITRLTTTMNAKPSESRIPHSTSVTDYHYIEPDELTIEGFLGCAGCKDKTSVIGAINTLKKAVSQRVYKPDDHFDIVTNHAMYSRMWLINVTVNASDQRHQMLNVTTKWRSANYAGTISNPSYESGGIYG